MAEIRLKTIAKKLYEMNPENTFMDSPKAWEDFLWMSTQYRDETDPKNPRFKLFYERMQNELAEVFLKHILTHPNNT